VVDGPIELGFHEWEVDRFCERDILSYHIKLCIEGIPHFAWSQEVAQEVLCDEASILHVEEDTQRKLDQSTYNCWVVTKDPSRIPQVAFLSLSKYDPSSASNVQVSQIRPRSVIHTHVFRVLIHIEVVEDLMFFHYSRAKLIQDGKVP
jgi:hypothetical protein